MVAMSHASLLTELSSDFCISGARGGGCCHVGVRPTTTIIDGRGTDTHARLSTAIDARVLHTETIDVLYLQPDA